MAPSFLSLPPELRVQIYRCLLCHDSLILSHSYGPVSKRHGLHEDERYQSPTSFSIERAILRTCRAIYSEAMPVLYGENTFLYSCTARLFDSYDHLNNGFLISNVKYMKNLQFEIHEMEYSGVLTPANVVSTLKSFNECGCELRTFELLLKGIRRFWEGDNERHHLKRKIATSQKVMAALVELKVFDTLTIALYYPQPKSLFDHELHKIVCDEFQDLVSRLASEKVMTITRQESCRAYDEDYVDHHKDHVPAHKLSWCLRPQRSQQSGAMMASGSS